VPQSQGNIPPQSCPAGHKHSCLSSVCAVFSTFLYCVSPADAKDDSKDTETIEARAPGKTTDAAGDNGIVQDVVVTGTRGEPVSVASSSSPIDIISADQLRENGRRNLRELLGTLVPSFTAASQPGGGTSASVRPWTMRGLPGDHVLVLVNGKRRHNTAIYNNFGTGSVPVDLDIIPVSAIDHIEVLRDGAAAQYGSDAIAGVINIILKHDSQGGFASVQGGRQADAPGDLVQPSLHFATPLGSDAGFLNFTLDARFQGPSYAAGNALGSFYYPLLNGQPVAYGTPGAVADPRDATVDRLLAKGYGRSNRDKVIAAAYNLEYPVSNAITFYSFSTFAFRNIVDTRGTFRPNDVSTLPEIFPNGFAAQRLIQEFDFQSAAGIRGNVSDWHYDFSSTYGRDRAALGAQNTYNPSLGPVYQNQYYLGAMQFDQLTTNLDLTRPFDTKILPQPLQVSWGLEHRFERWYQGAGEYASYADGGYVIPSGPRAGQRPLAGLVSFVGNSPRDAVSKSRNSIAAYTDLSTNLTDAWNVALAGRFEHYDDGSGNTGSGKFSTRYEVVPGFALRGTINNGFRAPALAQQMFSVTQSTSLKLADGTTRNQFAAYLPTSDPLAQALGAKPLKPERSFNLSAGFTYEPTPESLITFDAYQIRINDYIVKSELISDSGSSTLVRNRLASLGYSNIYAAQFNLNAANIQVRGLDVTSEVRYDLNDWGLLRLSALFSYNRIQILDVTQNPTVLALAGSSYTVFGRQAQQTLTKSTPHDKLILTANWAYDRYTVNLRTTRYGSYVEPGIVAANDLYFTPKWITDLDVSYRLIDGLTLGVGANNLFNIRPTNQKPNTIQTGLGTAYPTRIDAVNNYGQYSPYGVNGGLYYARLTYEF